MKDIITRAREFHETHKMKIGRDYRLEFLKLSKEDIYDFLETKYGDYIHVWRQKLQESEYREKQMKGEAVKFHNWFANNYFTHHINGLIYKITQPNKPNAEQSTEELYKIFKSEG